MVPTGPDQAVRLRMPSQHRVLALIDRQWDAVSTQRVCHPQHVVLVVVGHAHRPRQPFLDTLSQPLGHGRDRARVDMPMDQVDVDVVEPQPLQRLLELLLGRLRLPHQIHPVRDREPLRLDHELGAREPVEEIPADALALAAAKRLCRVHPVQTCRPQRLPGLLDPRQFLGRVLPSGRVPPWPGTDAEIRDEDVLLCAAQEQSALEVRHVMLRQHMGCVALGWVHRVGFRRVIASVDPLQDLLVHREM